MPITRIAFRVSRNAIVGRQWDWGKENRFERLYSERVAV